VKAIEVNNTISWISQRLTDTEKDQLLALLLSEKKKSKPLNKPTRKELRRQRIDQMKELILSTHRKALIPDNTNRSGETVNSGVNLGAENAPGFTQ